jgi:hypothetical protein
MFKLVQKEMRLPKEHILFVLKLAENRIKELEQENRDLKLTKEE